MSRGMKIFWIALGCLLAAGIALTSIGFALGGSGNVWFNQTGIHFGSRDARTIELLEKDTEAFENIDIKLVSADVEIKSAETYGYELSFFGTNEPEVGISNGTLKIVEAPNNWHFNIFGWGNNFLQEAKLTVYVPEGAVLDDVKLYTASGNTTLNLEESDEISLVRLDCKSASGDLALNGLNLKVLVVDVASGSVNLNRVTAANASVDMASGDFRYDDASVDDLKINAISGNVTFSGKIAKSLQLSMVSGDARFDLDGAEGDYEFIVKKVSGNVTINGNSASEGFVPSITDINEESDTIGRIDINLTSGRVDINFK